MQPLRFRLERIASHQSLREHASWGGIRKELPAKLAAARLLRERAGQNLYR